MLHCLLLQLCHLCCEILRAFPKQYPLAMPASGFLQTAIPTSVSPALPGELLQSQHSHDVSHLLCDVTDIPPYHTAALTRCRLRRGTRHNGVRCMVFIDPETSKHAGTQGHVSLCGHCYCMVYHKLLAVNRCKFSVGLSALQAIMHVLLVSEDSSVPCVVM